MKKDTTGEIIDLGKMGLTLEDLNLDISPNYVMCESVTNNKEEKTKSGIIVSPVVIKQGRHEHADILFMVIKAPKKLVHATDISNMQRNSGQYYRHMPWKTKIDIKEGDLVIAKAKSTYNCVIFKDGEKEYYRIHYSDLVLAFEKADSLKFGKRKRPVKIIDEVPYFREPKMLNGYIVCEELTERKRSSIIIDPYNKVDYNHGIIKHNSKPNVYYHNNKSNPGNSRKVRHTIIDDETLKVGNKVIKRSSDIHVLLQSDLHKIIETDARLFITQSCDLVGKYS